MKEMKILLFLMALLCLLLFPAGMAAAEDIDELCVAAGSGDMVKVTALLKKNPHLAQVKRAAEGYTALMCAAKAGDTAIARLLISKGADVNAKNVGGLTPLILAAQCNQVDMAALLLKHGAQIHGKDKKGKTALMYAREDGLNRMEQLLLKSGARE